MDALPLAGSGKPDRQVLIQLARDQNPSPPAGP